MEGTGDIQPKGQLAGRAHSFSKFVNTFVHRQRQQCRAMHDIKRHASSHKQSSKPWVKEGSSRALGVHSKQNHCLCRLFIAFGASLELLLWSTSYPLLHWGGLLDVQNRSRYMAIPDLASAYGWWPQSQDANTKSALPPLQDYTDIWTLGATGGLPASHGFISTAPSGGYGSLKDMISYRTDCSNVQPQWN